jgi:hypothetical protein
MDEKLARGRARELFRQLGKLSVAETSPRTPILAELVRKYVGDGGIHEWDVFEVALRFRMDIEIGNGTFTEVRLVRHPVRRKAIVETSFPSCIVGAEQIWAVRQSNTYVLEKNKLRVVETVHHTALSQHAVARLFQRGKLERDELVHAVLDKATLWTYPLLLAFAGEAARTPAGPGTQVAMPFADGLLLGTLEINYLDSSEQGPTITSFKLGGRRLRRLPLPFSIGSDAILSVSVNTFVGRHELFENQREILSVLEAFERNFQSSMVKMRRLVAFGHPDEEIIGLIGSPSFNGIDLRNLRELAERINDFVESDCWKQHSESHRRPSRFLQ